MTWPNFISLGRLFSVPLLVWLICTDAYVLAFWVMIAAGLSDILDGVLARALQVRSVIGSYLDPIADKVLLVGVFIALGSKGFIPLWILIVVLFRDLLIVGGVLLFWILGRPLTMQPIFLSKLNTFLQILLVVHVLGQKALMIDLAPLTQSLVLLTGLTTILSGIAYVRIGSRKLNQEPIP